MQTKKTIKDKQFPNGRLHRNLQVLSVLAKERKFQMWRYYVSHSILLIRSPKVGTANENIDIVIQGVSYINARTSYDYFSFELGNESDRSLMASRIGRALTQKERVFVLIGESWRDYIIALGVYPSVNSNSRHATPNLPFFEMYDVDN